MRVRSIFAGFPKKDLGVIEDYVQARGPIALREACPYYQELRQDVALRHWLSIAEVIANPNIPVCLRITINAATTLERFTGGKEPSSKLVTTDLLTMALIRRSIFSSSAPEDCRIYVNYYGLKEDSAALENRLRHAYDFGNSFFGDVDGLPMPIDEVEKRAQAMKSVLHLSDMSFKRLADVSSEVFGCTVIGRVRSAPAPTSNLLLLEGKYAVEYGYPSYSTDIFARSTKYYACAQDALIPDGTPPSEWHKYPGYAQIAAETAKLWAWSVYPPDEAFAIGYYDEADDRETIFDPVPPNLKPAEIHKAKQRLATLFEQIGGNIREYQEISRQIREAIEMGR